ncbi:hypothetical protein TNCV_3634801 [Trichonephila clavipes]|nr:hypothetical protein TNCV_3634801 [Trichonephila clavipes]
MRTGIWQLPPKKPDEAHHQIRSVSSLQLLVRQFQGADRVQTLRRDWSIYTRRPVKCVPLTGTQIVAEFNRQIQRGDCKQHGDDKSP